jgi:hypothetical protein
VAYNLGQILNRILFHLREDGFDPADVTPTFSADYPQAILTADVNDAIKQLIDAADFPENLTDVYSVVPVTATLDFALPANCIALDRVEYIIGGVQAPYKLIQQTFDEFDVETSGGQDLSEQGQAYVYRTPFGVPPNLTIRLFPTPTAGNVTAGDTLALYYRSDGNTLVNFSDYPSIPQEFHGGLFHYPLSLYFAKKLDGPTSEFHSKKWGEFVFRAKKWQDAVNMGVATSISDAEEVDGGGYYFGDAM